MAEERIRLNKISLREQKQKKAMYERFLPALEARKQQLVLQLAMVRNAIREQQIILERALEEINTWASLYWNMEQVLKYYISIREVRSTWRNVAGLKIREFVEVVYEDPGYSLFVTPYSFDTALNKTR